MDNDYNDTTAAMLANAPLEVKNKDLTSESSRSLFFSLGERERVGAPATLALFQHHSRRNECEKLALNSFL